MEKTQKKNISNYKEFIWIGKQHYNPGDVLWKAISAQVQEELRKLSLAKRGEFE